jgi:Tfp pilus assembly protein PilO
MEIQKLTRKEKAVRLVITLVMSYLLFVVAYQSYLNEKAEEENNKVFKNEKD